MKLLALLPLSLLAVSCFPADPYAQQPPPYRSGEPYNPYGPGGRRPGPQTPSPYGSGPYSRDPYAPGMGAEGESGQFEPVPGGNSSQAPPPVAPRPTSPRIDPDMDVADGGPAPAPTPAPRPTYPDAKRTSNPNQVISPYAPYNVIDVEGFKNGALAKDPSNGKIFRVP
ncbi:MAG: hypothetical protein EOP83_16860 [Verrucomicrobiaceae bacterium]|nr:MAG: hypothetical protein EOP83_16860 [Verrucomicrobiaceae bacterium]